MSLQPPFEQRRRAVLASLATVSVAGWPSLAPAQDTGALRIAQSVALSGPLGDLGQAIHEGAKAYFARLNNEQGGVNGRRIELVAKDDGYDVQRSLANIQGFLADPGTFALFGCMGTPMIEAMLLQVVQSGIPFFAPFSGAQTARPAGARNVFNIRASYADEAEQQVLHLDTLGIRRLGIAYQNNTFGKEVFEAALRAMQRRQLPVPVSASVENDASDAEAAATKLVAAEPEAVLVFLAGKPTVGFVKAIRAKRRGLSLYALSVMGTAATLRTLGDDGVGVTMSQVVPSPNRAVVPVVRDFLQTWKASGVALEPSHLGLEGYINARVFAEVLRRAGARPTRAQFIDAALALRRFDLGGFDVSFGAPGTSASRFIELTLVGRDGRFLR